MAWPSLTAWATAGVLGPVLINYLREYQLGRGVAPADAYNATMFILAAVLVLGFVCNWLIRPIAPSQSRGEPTK